MATRTITYTETTDDLTGEVIEDGESIAFSFDGTRYRIDLSTENAAAFRATLAQWITVAQRDGSYRQNSAPRSKRAETRERQIVRQWARAQGIDVPDRGRIPTAIEEAFREATEKAGRTA